MIRTRVSFAVSGEPATSLGDVTSDVDVDVDVDADADADAVRSRWPRIVKQSRANSSGDGEG